LSSRRGGIFLLEMNKRSFLLTAQRYEVNSHRCNLWEAGTKFNFYNRNAVKPGVSYLQPPPGLLTFVVYSATGFTGGYSD
jgi:hypothetical protein